MGILVWVEAVLTPIRCNGVILNSEAVVFCTPSRYVPSLSEEAFRN